MKIKILADFQICISVPLRVKPNAKYSTHFFFLVLQKVLKETETVIKKLLGI